MSKNKDSMSDIKDMINSIIDKNFQLFTREELERLFLHRDCLVKILREKLA